MATFKVGDIGDYVMLLGCWAAGYLLHCECVYTRFYFPPSSFGPAGPRRAAFPNHAEQGRASFWNSPCLSGWSLYVGGVWSDFQDTRKMKGPNRRFGFYE